MRRTRSLTDRRLEVLRLIANGLIDREIADKIGVKEDTVTSHAKDIYMILGANNRAHAIAISYERGILTGPTSDHHAALTDLARWCERRVRSLERGDGAPTVQSNAVHDVLEEIRRRLGEES